MNSRVRLALTSTLIVIAVLILVGATYQGIATALERRRYPHPGQLVSVGDHQLHIYCAGEGAPVVVLEAAAAAMSASWGWVQPSVAKVTRACSYDRAGLGWSEAGDRPYDPARVPEELRTLLTAARQPGPYVLAGHALGASFVRRFASLYPGDTAGLVFIDGSGEPLRHGGFLMLSPWLARTGVLRATGLLADGWNGLPSDARGPVSAFLNRPDHLTRASREVVQRDDAVDLGAAAEIPPGIPTAAVAARLNDEQDARRAADAILELVARLRRKR